MARSELIVFSGVDGAGKSTQIESLAADLRGGGHIVDSLWARGGYTPLFSLFKNVLRRVRPGALPKPGQSCERTRQFQSLRVRKVWLTFALLDLILCYAVWLRLKIWSGRIVLCDRYWEDTLLDFQRNFPQESINRWTLWRFLVWSAPRPDRRFLLMVPPEESVRRGKLKNEPFPDSPDTLEWRYKRYLELAANGDWTVIDCLASLEEVRAKIRKALRQCA